jgi:outer membrane protein assembly factor BamB
MRPRFLILIAILLFLSFVNTALSQSDSDPNVVFSLKEWAHWAPVVGADDPAFTLYDNRDLIYFNMSTWEYEYVRLTEGEYARLIEEVIPKDLPALEDYYMRIFATCQNEYYFYFGGESQRLVTVYGHPTEDDWFHSFNIPQSLRRCFNMLTGYRNQRAVPWFPEKFEVLVWDMFPSDYEYPQWPSDWPDLDSPDTIIRSQVHSIFLPSELFDEFIALGDAGQGIVRMNGKPMCIWYRMPIPGEEVFDQEFEEPNMADGKTDLHLAVEKGQSETAEMLIAGGADIDARTLYGNTPLLCALDFLQADTAGLLLTNGADVNAANSMGDTALHYTTDDKLRDTSELLIAGGLDVNVRNDANDTPLYCAARDGAAAVVELLLAEGADINAAKPDGRTALHAAAFHNHIEIVELLIANGADINPKTTEGHTPLDYALMAGRDEIAELLKSGGNEAGEILFCFEADGEIVSTPSIADDGTLYFGTQNATLYAVNPNGNLNWSWRYVTGGWGPQAFEGSPAIGEDGTIYLADDIAIPNYLFAISPEGEKKWEYKTYVVYGSMDASPVLLSDGTIFAGAHGFSAGHGNFGQLVALTPDGAVLDGFPFDTRSIYASPVAVDDVVIVAETDNAHEKVFAVNKNAEILWETELYDHRGSYWYSYISSLAIDHQKNIIIALNFPSEHSRTTYSNILQLDPLSGEILFEMTIPTKSVVVGSPVIDAAELGANVIVATENAHVVSLNPYADGEKLNYDLELGENSEAVGTPVIGDNGKLYHAVNSFGDTSQIDVFEINADGTINDGFILTILNDQVSSSLTMDNNGVIYFGTKGGKLYAVQTEAKGLSREAPWPTFRHDIRNTGNSGL